MIAVHMSLKEASTWWSMVDAIRVHQVGDLAALCNTIEAQLDVIADNWQDMEYDDKLEYGVEEKVKAALEGRAKKAVADVTINAEKDFLETWLRIGSQGSRS
jgi:hypothetical protein